MIFVAIIQFLCIKGLGQKEQKPLNRGTLRN